MNPLERYLLLLLLLHDQPGIPSSPVNSLYKAMQECMPQLTNDQRDIVLRIERYFDK